MDDLLVILVKNIRNSFCGLRGEYQKNAFTLSLRMHFRKGSLLPKGSRRPIIKIVYPSIAILALI